MDLPFTLPGYTLAGLLGFGGTGEVWRGVDEATGEPVALKRLWEPAAGELVSRLRRTAMLVDQTAGRHAVALRDVRMLLNDEVVLVMEYAAGGSLAGLLTRRGRLHPSEVVTLLAPLAKALATTHANALCHGDITPSNVVFGADGKPLLSDFGLALATGERPADDPGFRDPALSAGWAPGPASDVFGLAAIGYTALTGVAPRPADVMAGPVPMTSVAAISELTQSVPPALASVVEAALAFDPDARPDAAAFAPAVLRSCSAAPIRLVEQRRTPETDSIPSSSGGRHRAPKPARRRPRRVALTTVIVLSVVLSALTGAGWARLGPRPAAALPPSAAPSATASSAAEAALIPQVPTDGDFYKPIVADLLARRAEAFATGNVKLLRSVYAPTSSVLSMDYAALQALRSQELRAQGFKQRIDSITVKKASTGLVDMWVVATIPAYTIVNGSNEVVARRGGRTQNFEMTIGMYRGTWLVRGLGQLR